jgi:hypothetical protein
MICALPKNSTHDMNAQALIITFVTGGQASEMLLQRVKAVIRR